MTRSSQPALRIQQTTPTFAAAQILCLPMFYFFLLLTFSMTPSASACELPVCDISEEIKKMEGKNESYRFQLLSRLRQDFSKEKDEKKLVNLSDFARQAGDLVRRLGDADYVLREAKGLRDQSIYLLLQWVWRDCKRLSEGFKELAGETQRYAALDFFLRRAESEKDPLVIQELVCFARKSEATIMAQGDADYVVRHALLLASTLSNQLLEVNDGWEGVFRLQTIEGPLAEEAENLRFVIFSTGGELGIVGALSHPDLKPTVFQKLSFDGDPKFLSSRLSFATATPSTISIKFLENYLRIEGTILEPNEFKKIRFTAIREAWVRATSQNPCPEEKLLGSYDARLGDIEGRFVMTQIGPRQYASVFRSNGSELHLPYSFGRYNPSTGRLTFINLQWNVPLALRLLAEKNKDGSCRIEGLGLSTFTGTSYPIYLRLRQPEK
ncbi:MAG: hypothetical protein RL189_1263 [Pseudomonadota bacterium]|jgi:hypothetical protein